MAKSKAPLKKKPVEKKSAPVKAAKAAKPAPKAKPSKGKIIERPKAPAKSTLSKSDLEAYRKLLLEKRKEILGDVSSMQNEAFKADSNLSNMPIHMADVGTDNFEQEFTLGLMDHERQILREIQEALARIDEGSFGVCLGTGKSIPKVRLDAVPWAKYTIEYSRLLEQGKVGRNDDDDNDKDSDDDESDE